MQGVPSGPWMKIVPCCQKQATSTWWSKVCKGYLMVQDMKSVYWSKVDKGYIVVQGIQRVPSGPSASLKIIRHCKFRKFYLMNII